MYQIHFHELVLEIFKMEIFNTMQPFEYRNYLKIVHNFFL